ncbi:hypothetical protein ACLKA7_000831 [Drosophila subpalustris]
MYDTKNFTDRTGFQPKTGEVVAVELVADGKIIDHHGAAALASATGNAVNAARDDQVRNTPTIDIAQNNISLSELDLEVKSLKSKKAPGLDGIGGSAVKTLPDCGTLLLLDIFIP